MTLKNRLRLLEKIVGRLDVFRVIFVSNDADKEAARDRYREETGYRGLIVVMDETDRAL
jgi:hypothetical protein